MITTLNRKLSLALLAIVSSVGLAALIIGQLGMKLYYEELTQKLNSSIAMYVTDEYELIKGDVDSNEAIQQLARQAMIINPAVEVYLLSPQGRVMTHSVHDQTLKRQTVDLTPIREFLSGKGNFPLRNYDPRHDNLKKIFSVSEIREGSELKGYLYVVLGGKLYDNLSSQIAWSHISIQTACALAISVISCLLVGLLIVRILIHPLSRLCHDMNNFARSELGTKELMPEQSCKNTDEVSRLAVIYQAMSRKISDQLAQLRTNDRLRRELVSNVSHDLRTPLATIQGYIETLIVKQNSLSREQRLDYLYSAENGCHRLSRLICDLFELSKLDSGSKQPELEHFSLAELVHDTSQGFRLALETRNIALKIECPQSHALVLADIGMIQRVLDNLLRNAISHTPDNGRICVRISETSSGVNLTVENSGSYIAEQDLPHIFNRFYQSSLSAEKADSNPGGTGLGLAIVKRILEVHGSVIEVRSSQRSGTAFAFTLPV
ncbi:HAMP domain-containing sensor histidine kinase [Spongorhabdus nitratireducens]